MFDLVAGILAVIARISIFVLDIVVFVTDVRDFCRWITGSDRLVKVPSEQKALPAAAQRALAEAEQRRRDDASFIDRHVSPSCK